MVKGVNKTIIEVNDTGNEMFEKIVLYVTPKYGNLSNSKLKNEAEKILNEYTDSSAAFASVRRQMRRRRFIKKAMLAVFGAVAFTVALVLIF